MKITPVILSGGSGTRLWPVSRSLNPKQFLNFFGEHSLFQQTVLRIQNDRDFLDPIVICNHEHRFMVANDLQKIGCKARSVILEPVGRNTAPAIAIASIDIARSASGNGDDLVLVMPSDHIIEDKNNFITNIKKAVDVAMQGYIVTFGIIPNKPETGYGYIQKNNSLEGFDGIFAVEKFVEKPSIEIAEKFIKSDDYFWNSGIFMFKASCYLDLLEELQKDILINCKNSYDNAVTDIDFIRLAAVDFEKCSNISIDYAVMERAKKRALVPMNVGWSDVGSWQAVSEITSQDENQNSFVGDVVTLKTKNCYINSRDKLTTAIGVENLIIISLKDVVLVANKNNSQDVKKLFEILKEKQREECNVHTKVLRPWGSFETIDFDDQFKVKRITVKPKSSLSLQMHKHRAEHWVIVKGIAIVTCDDKEFVMHEDESTYIPIGKKHRLENREDFPLEIIEVQTGKYLGEDDIIRFNDIYGRAKDSK